jgi:hypothetical protein
MRGARARRHTRAATPTCLSVSYTTVTGSDGSRRGPQRPDRRGAVQDFRARCAVY